MTAPKPEVRVPFSPAGIPEELKALPRWMLWKQTWNQKQNRWGKVPYQANGRPAKSTDPATWCTFEEAASVLLVDEYDGLGFAFNGDGLVGIDLDKAVAPDGTLSDVAAASLHEVPGYAELSPSGRGLHIITRAPDIGTGKASKGVEVYSSGRYFTFTGSQINGHAQLPAAPQDLTPFLARHFGDIAKPISAAGDDPLMAKQPMRRPLAEMRATLTRLDPDMEEPVWTKVVWAIKHETAASGEGYALALEWSARGAKFDETALEEKWNRGNDDRANAFTWRSVERMAAAERPRLERVEGARFKPGALFMQGFEDVAYRVDGLLPDVGVAMIYGMSGVAKTFAMLDLAFAVHRGTEWLGNKTTAAPVFYVASEASRGIRKRIAAFMQKSPGEIPYFADRAPDLMSSTEIEEIAQEIEAAGGGGMLVIDTLATSHSGDENSAQDMGRVIQNATYLSLRLSCLVVLVHHSRKDGLDFRGSYALRANVDAVAEITAEGERPNRIHRIAFHKTRDDDDGQQLGFKLVKSEPLAYTASGKIIDSCTIEETPLTKKVPEKKKKPNDDMSLMLEVYEEISCLGSCTTVVEIIEAARVKAPSKKDYNLRRSLKAWIGYEGNRLPDELVVVL